MPGSLIASNIDPTLFSGTLRSNMDPFDEYSDEEILEALRRTHLLDDSSSMFHDLDMVVSEGGNNLSQGQRQLVCQIGRAHV